MGPNSKLNRRLALPTSSLFLSESVAGSARTCVRLAFLRASDSFAFSWFRSSSPPSPPPPPPRDREKLSVLSSPSTLRLHRRDGRSLHHRSHCISRWRRRKSRGPRTGEVVPASCQFWMAESTRAQAGQRHARFLRQRSLKRSPTAATAVLAGRSPLRCSRESRHDEYRGIEGDGRRGRKRRRSLDVQHGGLHKHMI